MDLVEKHMEESKLYYASSQKSIDMMLQHVIDFAKLCIRGAFLLNGSAAVAILTLFTNALIEKPELSGMILDSASTFAWGALWAVVSSSFAYGSQQLFLYESGYADGEHLFGVWCNQALERKNQRIKEFNQTEKVEEREAIQTEWQNEDVYFADKQERMLFCQKQKKCYNLWGEIFRLFAVVSIGVSFFCFFDGISTTKGSFLKDSMKNIPQMDVVLTDVMQCRMK